MGRVHRPKRHHSSERRPSIEFCIDSMRTAEPTGCFGLLFSPRVAGDGSEGWSWCSTGWMGVFVEPFLLSALISQTFLATGLKWKTRLMVLSRVFIQKASCRTLPYVDLNWISKRPKKKKSNYYFRVRNKKCDAFFFWHCEMRCYLSCKEKQTRDGSLGCEYRLYLKY